MAVAMAIASRTIRDITGHANIRGRPGHRSVCEGASPGVTGDFAPMRDLKKLATASALVAALIASAVPALAQTGRIGGTVKNPEGQPIKGATILAENPQASPSS